MPFLLFSYVTNSKEKVRWKGGVFYFHLLPLSHMLYKPESRGFDSPMVSLEFLIDIILPAAL